MADLDGMLLCGLEQAVAGGAFLRNRPAPVDATLVDPLGWTIEVRRGGRYVVAGGGAAAKYEDARLDAFAAAQRGLDLLSIGVTCDLATVSAEDEHLAWWLKPRQALVRRSVGAAMLGATVPPATVVVTDADGNVIANPPPVEPT